MPDHPPKTVETDLTAVTVDAANSPETAILASNGTDIQPPLPAAGAEEESVLPARLTTRALHHAVWTLAWPSVMTMLLQTVNGMMDTFFVGHLSNAPQALAATGVGGSVLFLLISLAMGVTVGTTALVARFTGAGDHEEAVHATGQSLALAVALALVFGTLTYMGRSVIVGWMLDRGHNPEAAALCIQFLSAALLGALPLFIMNVFHAAFRGLGDTRTPMLVTVVAIATHISLNAALIYGRLGFPRLGVQGAGTAFALSQWVGMTLFFGAVVRSPLAEALRRAHLIPQVEWLWRILRIGIPAAIQAVIRTLGMMSFTGILARAPEAAAGVAAMQIGMRAESIAFMPGFGYSVAASALVGQSLGARDPERAERCAWASTGQAICVMSAMAVLFFSLANLLPLLFTGDPLVRHLAADYLRIMALSEPFLALGMVLTGALQGAGDTLRPTYITFFTFWIVRLPLAEWLMFPLHLNARGAWLAMAITTVVGGILTVALFHSGKWKRIKV
ncbi:MAG TPA: MATE family efflux transporter [Chthonomonadaceae bacterium]|nr:MATE family efflux transporter [Chthonomonadaceae bacterium]